MYKIKASSFLPLLFYKVFPGSLVVNFSPIALLLFFLNYRAVRRDMSSWGIHFPVVLTLSFAFLFSTFFSSQFEVSFKPIVLLISSYFGSFYIVSALIRLRPSDQLNLFLFYSLLVSIPSFGSGESSWLLPFPVPIFNGITGFGGLSTVLYPYLIILSLWGVAKLTHSILYTFAFCSLLLLSYNTTDTVIILSFVLVAVCIRYQRYLLTFVFNFPFYASRKFLGILLIFLVVFAALSLYIFSIYLSNNFEYYQLIDALSSYRLTLAYQARLLYESLPLSGKLFGLGYESYKKLYSFSDVISRVYASPKMYHNTLISSLLDTGLIGFALYLSMIIYPFMSSFKKSFSFLNLILTGSRFLSPIRRLGFSCLLSSLASLLTIAGMDKQSDLLLYSSLLFPPLFFVYKIKSTFVLMDSAVARFLPVSRQATSQIECIG